MPIVQAISLKMRVKSLNSCQTIVRRRSCIPPILLYRQYAVNFQKIGSSKQFLKHFTARIENLVGLFTIDKSAKMYTNCRHFVTILVTKIPPKCIKKRSQKACTLPVHLKGIFLTFAKRKQSVCRSIADPSQTIGL
jgi:hypothetical protein